jgi:hypothetical protein
LPRHLSEERKGKTNKKRRQGREGDWTVKRGKKRKEREKVKMKTDRGIK